MQLELACQSWYRLHSVGTTVCIRLVCESLVTPEVSSGLAEVWWITHAHLNQQASFSKDSTARIMHSQLESFVIQLYAVMLLNDQPGRPGEF